MIADQAVLSAVRDAVFVVDIHTGMILDANPAAEVLSGRNLAELRFLHHTRLYPAEQVEAARRGFEQDIQAEGVILHKTGRCIPVEISSSHFTSSEGKQLVVGVFRDTTERNAARDALRRSEERFRQVAESAGEFIWEVDADGVYRYASRAVEQILGFTPEELVGKMRPSDLLVPETRGAIVEEAAAIMGRHEPFRAFFSWRLRRDGKRVALETSGLPFADESGLFSGYRGASRDVTERMQAEERLRERERDAREAATELRAIMDAAPAAIFIAHDSECKRISGNRTASALLREPPGSNLSKTAPKDELPVNFRVIRDGIEIPPSELPIQRAAWTGQPVQGCELDVCFEDGSSRHLMGNVQPLLDEDGHPKGAVAVLADITERKRQELELRKFLSLAENSQEFIGICDMNLMPFYINPAGLLLVGLNSLEQTQRTPVPEFFFPEDQRFVTEEFFPRVIREGRAEVEIRFRNFKTGKPLWMIYNAFYIQDPAGKPVGLATVSRDITERMKAEAALRESEERFRDMADQAPVMLWVSGTDRLCTFFNRPWLEFTGRTMDQEIGDGWASGVHPDDLDHCLATYLSSFDGRRSFQMEYRLRRADGEYRWILDNGTPRFQAGEFVGFIGSCLDVTGRKQVEDRLRNSEQELRQLAGSVLTAQENERRRISRELHDDVTQRLAFFSIELDKLSREIPDSNEDMRARVQDLQEQTLKMSSEVRRLSHGLHPSAIEDFGLSIALEEFCHQFEIAKSIVVEFEGFIDDSRLDATGAACLYRVAQEALRNAHLHGQATHIRVDLTADEECIRLRIRDNGSGFSTGNSQTKTGLGLIGMRERIRFVNGMLTISSHPGQGTEIIASVPLTGAGHEASAYSVG
jgi:PAS domain S-box-containing protein